MISWHIQLMVYRDIIGVTFVMVTLSSHCAQEKTAASLTTGSLFLVDQPGRRTRLQGTITSICSPRVRFFRHNGLIEFWADLIISGQPDLNWENKKVRDEVKDIIHFWAKKGEISYNLHIIYHISTGIVRRENKAAIKIYSWNIAELMC